jgi:hypothetical protein
MKRTGSANSYSPTVRVTIAGSQRSIGFGGGLPSKNFSASNSDVVFGNGGGESLS